MHLIYFACIHTYLNKHGEMHNENLLVSEWNKIERGRDGVMNVVLNQSGSEEP